MSKWLKRGKGSNSNSNSNSLQSVENGPEASVRSNMAPGAATATATATSHHYAASQAPPQSTMPGGGGGYAPAPQGGRGMDVIDSNQYGHGHHADPRSSKYHPSSSPSPSQNYSHHVSGSSGSGQRRSSSGRTGRQASPSRVEENGDSGGGRTRQRSRSSRSGGSGSGRSSSRSRRERSRERSSASSQQQQQQQQQSSQHQQPSNGYYAADPPAGGATHAPPQHGGGPAPPQHHHGYGTGGPQTASTTAGPPPQYGKPSPTVTPTQDHPSSNQVPSYPPAVSSSNSQQSTHRRPAYLLHRDLVIGKGSYGQVCIASRGEAEGHVTSSSSSGGGGGGGSGSSGKRKKFACKCVVLRNDPKYIAKLQEEVNVLRELRGHENVIRLYDVFCVDNELFIITELGRGGDLFHLLTTHPKHGVTEAYAAKTVAQMLSAVAFLHSRSICHRDLKLENWVLESGKDVWSPLKLIDFGLSTHYTPGHRLSRVVGSSYYVAPEVLKKSYTEACDLWSLGVIVYMLLSGAPPFYGKNDEAIKASIVQGEYTFPHELFRDVSDEAMAFVSCLLSYNTEYRYTAEQALTHGWLASNCDPDQLQRAKDGARGAGPACTSLSELGVPEPMQL